MDTVVDNIKSKILKIETEAKSLLIDHSKIYRWNEPGSMVITANNYSYQKLSDEGKQLQSKVLSDYKKVHAIIEILLLEQPKDVKRKLKEATNRTLKILEQENTWIKSTNEAFEKLKESLEKESLLLNGIYDYSNGNFILIPDTNVLLSKPNLTEWNFQDIKKFCLVLTPTVLSELDELKVTHRVESVREKSQKIIRQIKEFRRRGRLTEGVVVVKDKSEIIAIATEPDFTSTLDWLLPDNNDDRLIASSLEVMRRYPKSPVILVTGDINLQNKAELAQIPIKDI